MRIAVVTIFGAVAAVGCGGGSSGGTTTPPPNPPPPPPTVTYAVERAFPILEFLQPVAMLQAPGDSSRWYMVEKGGRITMFDNDDSASTTTEFADISARVNSGPSEAGLLGVAFHPDYANNRSVFVSYTAESLESRISHFFANANGDALDAGSETILLRLVQPFFNHNGGDIAFGPDGMLYIAIGDGGSAGDPNGLAQDSFNWFGAILRLDVTNLTSYSIPPDNPFANGQAAAPEVYAYGFRNPWRFSFDRVTGDLWLGDVGQNRFEEVDRVVAGGNYGWRCYEGDTVFNQTGCPPDDELEFPAAVYANPGEGISVTGGYVYRGAQLTSLAGVYLFGDFGSGTIWGLTPDGAGFQRDTLIDSGLSIASFAEGNDGELFVLDLQLGGMTGVYRIVESP